MSTKTKLMNNQTFDNSVPSFGFGGKTVIRPLPNSRSSATSQQFTVAEIKAKILAKENNGPGTPVEKKEIKKG